METSKDFSYDSVLNEKHSPYREDIILKRLRNSVLLYSCFVRYVGGLSDLISRAAYQASDFGEMPSKATEWRIIIEDSFPHCCCFLFIFSPLLLISATSFERQLRVRALTLLQDPQNCIPLRV